MFMNCLSVLASLSHGFLSLHLPGTSISLAAILAGLVFFPIMVRTMVKLFDALEGPDTHHRTRTYEDNNWKGDN